MKKTDEVKKKIENSDDLVNLQLTSSELEVLLDIFEFTNSAARLLASQEVVKGSMPAARRMERLSKYAATLHKTVVEHIVIGEPEDTGIH